MTPSQSPSILMVAGEVSGDMHAARVIKALLQKNKNLRIFGLGGPQMAEAGMDVREDLTRQALIGFWEVLKHYPQIRRRFRDCEEWLVGEKPDLLVLVDYPGFNLRLAERARRLGVPVCYYVAPQVWAWHESRIKTIQRVVRKLLVILPFEKDFFRRRGVKAVYVGHPLLEEMDLTAVDRREILKKYGLDPARFPLVCAMPGSRKGEIGKIWPLYLKAARLLKKSCPDAAFIVPKPHGLEHRDYRGLTPDDPFLFVEAPAYDLRKICDLAWVKSGTGTLETALLRTPMIVVYKVAAVTGFLAKRLLKIKNVSLVNLLSGREVVTELLQERAKPRKLVEETHRLLDDRAARRAQLEAFKAVHRGIARPPRASQNAAREILGLLKKKS